MKKIKQVIMVLVLTMLTAWPLLALESSEFEGVWYRDLGKGQPRFTNDNYRMELYSFEKRDKIIATICIQIYPKVKVRTLLSIGSSKQGSELRSVPSTLVFDRTHFAEAFVHESPQGFPVLTYLDSRGIREAASRTELRLALPGNKQKGLVINGELYRSFSDDIEAAAFGTSGLSEKENAELFLKLFNVHIYTIEARIPKFGTVAMMNMNQSIAGLSKGQLGIKFEARGLFGLGNSGVMFTSNGASEFPGFETKGQVFGGVFEMEGILHLYRRKANVLSYLGSMNSSFVKLKNGVTSEGSFHITLAKDTKKVILVSHNLLSQ